MVYARVSTTQQAQAKKVSIPTQIQAARKIAAQRGWTLVHEPYVDAGISGTKLEERKGLQRMLRDADQGKFDLLILYDNDRLSRKGSVGARVYDRLDQAGVQVYSIHQPVEPQPPGTYDPEEDDTGLITRSLGSLSSELSLRSLHRRVRLGKERRARAGYTGSGVPYGYRVTYRYGPDGRLEKLRQPHPQEAPLVPRLFEEYRQGKSLLDLAQALNREGVPTKKGRVWCSQTVRSILRNPVYCGEVVYGLTRFRHGKRMRQDPSQWIRVPGKHLPLISRELFAEVQTQLRGRAYPRSSLPGRKRELSGLLKCGYCGWALARSGNWHGGTYICGQYHQSRQCQRNGHYRVPELEARVWGELQRWRQDPQLRKHLRQQSPPCPGQAWERELAQHRHRRNEFPARRERLLQAYERGTLSLEEFEAHQLDLTEEEQRLQQQTQALEQQLAHRQQRQQVRASVRESLRAFDTSLTTASPAQRRHLLRALIEKIVIHQQKVQIHYRLS